jgi:hypothetical protein
VEAQVRVTESPALTSVAEALKVSVGGGITVTVADALAVPPAPLQLMVKVDVTGIALIVSLPKSALVPLQAPEAPHALALVELQLRVLEPPAARESGEALSVRTGG